MICAEEKISSYIHLPLNYKYIQVIQVFGVD